VRGPISSPFGQRGGRLHAGIDIAVPTGRPIKAAARGRVTYAGWMSGYGNIVIITHSGGWTTRYGHQSRLGSHVGQRVAAGKVIGYVGATGDATGPHLHFETRHNGSPLNPLLRLP
jgi:murein DD-endopeptidase MepM/ murein hydrolase activator NlpD